MLYSSVLVIAGSGIFLEAFSSLTANPEAIEKVPGLFIGFGVGVGGVLLGFWGM